MSLGSFPLSSLPLSKPQLSACEQAGYHTASDILLAAPTELNRKLKNLTTQNIQGIVRIIAKSIAPVPRSVGQSDQRGSENGDGDERRNGESSTSTGGNWVGTGNAGLDEVLGGGLQVGTLTEISGESAAGKSHLCMVLALSAQLPACTTRPGGAVILTSEREVPTDRLIQLAKTALAAHDPPESSTTVKDLLDNIHTNRCLDIDALEHALSYSLPWELEKRRQAGKGTIRLLVLDSITALLRGGETALSSSVAGLAQRSKYLCAIADKLKALAVEYELAVVVINQVSDVFTNRGGAGAQGAPSMTQQVQGNGGTQFNASQQPGSSGYGYETQFFTDPGPEPPMLYATQARWFSGQSQGYMKEASLGIVWANAVNTRIMLSRTGRRRRVQREALTTTSRKRHTRVQSDGTIEGDQHQHRNQDDDAALGIMLDDSTPTLIRRFHVVFSPFAPPSTIDYIISPSGIHTLEGTRKMLDLESIIRKRKRQDEILAAIADGEDIPGPPGGADEYADEVFDDLADVPAEFWEGKFDAASGQGSDG